MRPQTARRLARAVLGAYLALAAVGFVLQVLSGRTYLGLGIPFVIGTSVIVAVWCGIGSLLIHRHPHLRIGWVMLFGLIAWGLDSFFYGLLSYFPDPPSLVRSVFDLGRVWLVVSGFPFSVLAFTYIFMLFPTGAPLSTRWGRVGRVAVLACTGFAFLSALKPVPFPGELGSPIPITVAAWAYLGPLWWACLIALFACLLAAGFSLVLRLRRSRGEVRQQIKLFAFAAGLFPLHVIPMAYAMSTGSLGIVLTIGLVLLIWSFLAMGLAIAVGILKYRLYDIDILINRTLVYGTVTVALALLYFASVFVFQRGLSAVSGQRSPLAIVASTLITAVLFQPLRRRVQASVDRRFYRSKYDAQRLLERFAGELRDEVDPEAVVNRLLDAARRSLQPAHASIWLRPQ